MASLWTNRRKSWISRSSLATPFFSRFITTTIRTPVQKNDTTNFYTYIASTNTRNHLAQRGHNKQGRHNLRQVGLSYVLDGESGLSLCHHV
ncbi:MAG TPA: hypothetical protein VK937_16105, partial [Candidatus Limnocylindria bacterium]|nr:hypothetical protein [Candidatus Limnocylindria bacterium]